MKVIPFLNKNDEQQVREIEKLYASSDFLILPTRSEAYGVVFCEAGVYGLPIITAQTGGVPEVVIDGENGYVLPFEARGAEYAAVIAKLYRDDARYAQMVRSSRAAYDERLNWDTWAKTVHALLQEVTVTQGQR